LPESKLIHSLNMHFFAFKLHLTLAGITLKFCCAWAYSWQVGLLMSLHLSACLVRGYICVALRLGRSDNNNIRVDTGCWQG